MRDLGPRIEAVEDRLGPEEEPPGPLVYRASERSFADHLSLQRWTRERERPQRAASRIEPEEPTGIAITLVRCCGPGEEPSERDLGEPKPTTLKRLPGVP